MSKQILIIDDSESIRVLVANTLTEAGYTVHKAINGKDALKKLQTLQNLSLILSDLNMPEMDGITLVSEVRRLEKFAYLPILMLTTETEVQKKLLAKEAGATGWITKPFDKEKLLKTITKVIG